jgi:hypothetical protein
MNRAKSTTPSSSENNRPSQIRSPASFVRSGQPGGIRARGRRGESLASARDRLRLRERNQAERERVEGMLAGAAVPIERRAHSRESIDIGYNRFPIGLPAGLRAVQPAGCPVCGDSRTVSDEVMHGGMLRVSECLHCEHRWTRRPKARWAELGANMNRTGRPQALESVEARRGKDAAQGATHPV